MSNFKSQYADGSKPVPVAGGSEVVSVRGVIAVPNTLASADILEAMELPEDHIPVDFEVDADDLDTHATPTITLSAGILNAGKTDLSVTADDGGAVWLVNSTIAQTGGLVRPTTVAVKRVVPKAVTRRMVGLKVTAAGSTKAAGDVGFTLKYRSSHYGV